MVLRFPTWVRASIRPGQELGPTQPSLRSLTAIMITCSNSPVEGSGMPNHYVGDLLPTIGISGLSRVRTELLQLCVVHDLGADIVMESFHSEPPAGSMSAKPVAVASPVVRYALRTLRH